MSPTLSARTIKAGEFVSHCIGHVINPESRIRKSLSRSVKSLDQHPGWLLFGVGCVYLSLTIALASIKLLWLDEFITFYIAKLGHVRAIWAALGRGADPNPPLNYLLVLLSTKVFGQGEVALRLPAILASGAGLAALFAFLRRRVPPIYAVAGVLLFMCTAAFDYSFESRSYALLLGFSALSLVAWRSSIEGTHQTWGAIALAVVLAAGLSSNYFAVLAFFPVAAGELVRDLRGRRVEWRVWIAMAVAGSILLIYMPLVNKAVATFSPYAWNKVQLDAIADSYLEMVEVILWPALGICAAGLVFVFLERKRAIPAILPQHEAVAAFVLMLYPFIAYGIARIHGGMLSPRFVVPVCYGFAIAATVLAFRMLRQWDWAGLLLVFMLVCWLFAREGVVAKMYYDQRLALERIIETIPPATTAIAVPDSLLVLPMYHYAPPGIASRIVFPVDFAAIRKYKREDSPEQNLWHGRDGIYPVPIVSLDKFTAENSEYLIAAADNNWLVKKLVADGDPAHILPIFTDTKDIQGFTPLCHGPVWFFAKGSASDLAPVDARTLSIHDRAMEAHANAR
jgi:hypothetical protein